MVVMYCYGSSFHMSQFLLNDPVQTDASNPFSTPNSLNFRLAMGVVGMSSSTAASITKKVD